MIARARAGDFKGAHDIAAGFTDDSTRFRALRDLAEIQAEKGDVKEAMARAMKSAPPVLKTASLVAIAEGILNRLEEQQGQKLGIKSRRRPLEW